MIGKDGYVDSVFQLVQCGWCEMRYAVVRDFATGNLLYYPTTGATGEPIHNFPHPVPTCPNPDCTHPQMEILSRCAVLTSSGKWLDLDLPFTAPRSN